MMGPPKLTFINEEKQLIIPPPVDKSYISVGEEETQTYGALVAGPKRSRSVMKLSGTNINFNPASINYEGAIGAPCSESDNSMSLTSAKRHKEFQTSQFILNKFKKIQN